MESRGINISPNGGVRESNMELLRIVAMLLVMVVHANFRALPVPDTAQVNAAPGSSFMMFLTESISVISVDLFVLLSGWFGIRFKAKRLGELAFQVLFFGLFAIGVCYLFAPERLADGESGSALSRLFLCGENDYWFVKSYVALYIISPVINTFIEHATKRQFATVLIVFFAFQSVYGWMFNATRWFEAGYSLPSFAGLYMLARYMRLYPVKLWKCSKWVDAMIYAGYVVILTVAMFVAKKAGIKGGALYFYSCPLVILGAMHFMLFFTKLPSFKSKFVNWIAISAFAIYLTHSSSFLAYFYDNQILKWFNNESVFPFIIYTASLIAVVFIASIIIDKLRIALWNGFMLIIRRKK